MTHGGAESIFRDFTARAARGERPDIETLCSEHPELADELRHRYADWVFDAMARDGGASVATLGGSGGTGASSSWATILERLKSRDAKWQRYDIRGEVARGGMGTVLQVFDKDLLRTLAMKVIRGPHDGPASATQPPAADDRALGRFLEEAQVSGQLDHPGIVPVHDLGLDAEGLVFFTMKLVKGDDLRAVFEKVKSGDDGWSVTRALSVLLRVCEAMAYAHAKGVIHRDLKPGNVMVGRFGEVYVMDWGLARILGEPDRKDLRFRPEMVQSTMLRSDRKQSIDSTPDSPLVTMDGDVVGTPAYMPPEQAGGRLDELGPWSDVYAVGAMLYELLAGHMPYVKPGDRASNRTVLAMALVGPPPSLESEARNAPSELVAICEKAMGRDRAARYAGMAELADDLRAFLERRVVTAYEAGSIAELKKWIARNRPLATAAAAAFVALLVLGSWALRERSTASANEHSARNESMRAEETARHATAIAQSARENAAEAALRTMEASARRAEFEQLAGVAHLNGAIEKARSLHPAWPEKIPAMEHWLAHDAARLRSLLPVIRKTIVELEERAVPRVPGDSAGEKLPPRFAALESLPQVEWMRRCAAVRRGDVKPEDVELPCELAEGTAAELLDFSRRRYDFDEPNRIFGEDALALAATRSAIAKIEDGDSSSTLSLALVAQAWACFATARDDEARAACARARRECPASERAMVESSLAYVEEVLDDVVSDSSKESFVRVDASFAALEAEAQWRRSWRLPDDSQQFLHHALADVAAGIEELIQSEEPGVRKRLGWAQRIAELTLHHPNARASWAEARAAIANADGEVASSLYRDPPIDLQPQMGLVPIGMNPVTKLWEFLELRSACDWLSEEDAANIEIPRHRDDGTIDVKDTTGIVFVLLPGGTFMEGAQNQDANGPNFDPGHLGNAQSPQRISLCAFFLARHELTLGQLQRLSEEDDPALNRIGQSYEGDPAPIGESHPVENVSWDDCESLLSMHGLVLPTQSQWEFAARGGTDTPWWTGRDATSLSGAENLAGRSGGAPLEANDDPHVDRFSGPAPVGTFRANRFGLHDMLGNVSEWCADGHGVRPAGGAEDGRLVPGPFDPLTRATCGGSFEYGVADARVAIRGLSIGMRSNGLGLRPARKLEHSMPTDRR